MLQSHVSGIHTGSGGELRWQSDCDFRLQNGVVRDQAEIVDRVFVMGIGIGDDSGQCCFTSGSGCGGTAISRGSLCMT